MKAYAMMAAALIAAAATVAATPAAAQSMNADQFYREAKALSGRGPLALLSSNFGKLKAEMQRAMVIIRRDRGTCLPKKVALSSNDIIDGFGHIPAAERVKMSTADGLRHVLNAKYGCR